MPHRLAEYQPRVAEHGVLYRVIDEHLETFLDAAAQHADGHRLPKFVEQEFRDFLTCGVLEHGFARLRCGDCVFERLVPFSCKGRCFCPSCGGRRMTECAARLVDGILPHVPVRQWVLSLPHRLRYLLAWDHELCRSVLAVYARALLSFQRRRARRGGLRDGHSGCVTVIQRFGGGLNLNVHFHTLVFDGVFTEGEGGALRFRPLPPPTDEEVGVVLATIYVRVVRLLRRRGFDASAADLSRPDPVADESPMLAGISSASIQGRIALGPRAGARCGGWGRSRTRRTRRGCCRAARGTPTSPASISTRMSPCPLPIARGWNTCRYLLRPPVAQDRLRRMGDDRILLTLKTPWADGTRHLLFAPIELLEKLAALTPRPRINLILYHGVLAPHALWRARVVAYGPLPGIAPMPPNLEDDAGAHAPLPQPRHWAWANLMRRAFDLDVLACPRCGGRLRLLGTIEDPAAIRAILDHLAASAEGVDRAPPLVTLKPATLATQL